MRIKLFISFICIISFGYAQNLSVESIWKSGEFYPKRIEGFTALSDGQSFTKIVEEDKKYYLKKYQFKDYKGTGTALVDLSEIKFNGKTLEFDDVKLSK